MGNSGRIVWFTERTDLESEGTARALIGLFGPVTGVHVARFDSEDTSWARFNEEEADPEYPIATTPEKTTDVSLRVDSVAEAVAMLKPGVFQFFEPYAEQETRGIGRAVLRDIPDDIRGRCTLSTPSVGVGGCDIWDIPCTGEDDAAVYYGRAQYYVELFGSTTPTNVWEYEPRYLEIPEVRRLERDIESILGPLKRCIIWSV